MTLLDRIKRAGSIPQAERFGGHLFENLMKLFLQGNMTRTKIIDELGVPAGFESDFDQFKTEYDTLTSAQQKDWVFTMEASVIAIQSDIINKGKFNTNLGLSLDTT